MSDEAPPSNMQVTPPFMVPIHTLLLLLTIDVVVARLPLVFLFTHTHIQFESIFVFAVVLFQFQAPLLILDALSLNSFKHSFSIVLIYFMYS